MTSETNKAKLIQEILDRATAGAKAWDINWNRMDEDVDFLDGENQWPEDIKAAREDESRPCLTFNKMPSYVDQITGKQRDMSPAIDVFPADGDVASADLRVANLAGNKDYSLAEVYQGLIRNIEYVSSADLAYDTAFEHCAGHGMGFFRILTEYSDDDTFDQDFKIKRIRNWRSVICDPAFEEPDGSDMRWCMIFTRLHKDEFERRYPGKETVDIENHTPDVYETWVDGDYVRIAEYYRVVSEKITLNRLSDGRVVDAKEMEPIQDELAKAGITVERSRTDDSQKVEWMKVSGADILEEAQETVFHQIPVIPVLGKELTIRGNTIYRGAIRHAKDPQRMYNYWRTASIETVALQPKAPYIISDKQLEGYQDFWDQANTKNLGYLPYKETGGQIPQRQPPPQIPAGQVNEAMSADNDIRGTMGMFQPDIGQPGAEQSGVAIDKLQRKGDTNNLTFSDNLMRSIRQAGRLLIKAIPKVYDTQRVIRMKFPDGKEDFVTINQTVVDEQTGQEVTINDLSVGKYDVMAKAGPSYLSQRQEASEAIFQVMQSIGASNPVTSQALAMLGIKNMDWPEADEVVKILRKSLPPGLVEPEEGEEPPEPPPPTPQDQAMQAKAEAEMAKAEATKAKAAADMEKAQAEIIKAQATMMEVAEKMENLDESIRDSVAAAFAQLISEMNQPNPEVTP